MRSDEKRFVETFEGLAFTVKDATPRTLYVSRQVLNAAEILRWARSQGIENLFTPEELHVTVMYSRAKVDWMKTGESWAGKLEIAAGGPRVIERFGDGEAIVLCFNCSELRWRHEDLKNAGAEWDKPEYQPHITLSIESPGLDVMAIQPYTGPIVLGPEIYEEVKNAGS